MRILVTGGAGYIGSHTAKVVARSHHEPVVYDNLSEGHRSAVRWGPLVEGDLGRPDMVREILERYQIDAVIHFAASAYVGESMLNPRKYFHNNVVNSLHLFDAMMDVGIKTVVFSSSCASYGTPDHLPIDEDHVQRPVNPYGESKLFVERVLQWYGEAYDLRWVALRYFNAAGADPDGEIGEGHDPETHLIPLAMRAVSRPNTSLQVFGTDFPTPDGTAVRDYIHVMDLAGAHLLALEYLVSGGPSRAINLGTGRGHSVLQVVRTVERITGGAVPVDYTGRRPGDPAVLVADSRRAADLLSWQPHHPDLDEIVTNAWHWFTRNRDTERGSLASSSDG